MIDFNKQTTVCIIGAGPGGAAAALTLAKAGISVTLFDKQKFPRDKICGDAISSKALTILGRIHPELLQNLQLSEKSRAISRAIFYSPDMNSLDIHFKNLPGQLSDAPGYVMKRYDFDHFLVEEVKKQPNITLLEATAPVNFKKHDRGYQLFDKSGSLLSDCKLLIDAGGAYSKFSREQAGLQNIAAHYGIAIRAYARNINWANPPDAIEFYFIRGMTPGYLWIFPLPDGSANIGAGLRKDLLKRRKVDLKQWLTKTIRTHPLLAPRFANALLDEKIQGYGLPLGSVARSISGDHYLLVGDAAHLIDPLTGEGIGNAVYSGYLAAQTALEALKEDDFSAQKLSRYDRDVSRILGAEMRLSYRLQQLMTYPVFCNLLVRWINRHQGIIELLSRMPGDFDVREALLKPGFWLKRYLLKK